MYNLVGHINNRILVDRFSAAKAVNRSFLITGGQDSGKTFFGKYFASKILDQKVFRNSNPDFFYLKSYSAKYQEILEEFIQSSFKQPYKNNIVVFLDDADQLPRTSLNKILKTVEEPPEKTTIILSAQSKDNVLDTIQSRCFKIHLSDRTESEKIEILREYGRQDVDDLIQAGFSLKEVLNADINHFREEQRFHTSIFNSLKTDKKVISDLSKPDFDFGRFILFNSNQFDSISYKKFISNIFSKFKRFNNRYVLAYNLYLQIQEELKT